MEKGTKPDPWSIKLIWYGLSIGKLNSRDWQKSYGFTKNVEKKPYSITLTPNTSWKSTGINEAKANILNESERMIFTMNEYSNNYSISIFSLIISLTALVTTGV